MSAREAARPPTASNVVLPRYELMMLINIYWDVFV